MGFLSRLFGKDKRDTVDTRDEEALLAEEARLAKEKEDEVNALEASRKKSASELATRGTNMQGGGRKGLMFRGNSQGVA